MERKQKRILVLCSFAVTILIILTILSLLAPHGEDFRREKSSGILEGQLQTEEGGIYLQAEVSGEPALLGRGEDAGQWVFTVEESGDYYLSAGYMALEGNGQELEFSLLLDGSKVTDSAVTLTRTWRPVQTYGFRRRDSAGTDGMHAVDGRAFPPCKKGKDTDTSGKGGAYPERTGHQPVGAVSLSAPVPGGGAVLSGISRVLHGSGRGRE